MIGPLEDPADYRAFEQAVTTAYDAETAIERELVLRLASLLWRLRRATSVETGLFQIQCEGSTAPDPALPKLPGEACEVIEIFQSGRDSSGRELARCFLRLADLDNGIFERLGRYEAALWRQVRQTIFTLQHLQWRAPWRPLSENAGSLAKDGFWAGGRGSGGRALGLPLSRAHKRGASRSSRTLGAECDGRGSVRRARMRAGRVMLKRSLRDFSQTTVSNKPGHRGEVSRKTIAQGRPGLLR